MEVEYQNSEVRGRAAGAGRIIVLLAMVLSGFTLHAQEEPFEGAAVLEREALIRAVLERNPGIESMRQAWLATGEREAQSSALDDVRVMAAIAPESIWSEHPFGYMLRVEQMVPWRGKRGLRVEMDRAMADAMLGDFASARLSMALMASMLYDELYAAERMLALNHHHIRLMEKMKESAEAMYVASAASLQDPIEAEVAIAKMEMEQASIEAMIVILGARLNALLHRRPTAPLPPVRDVLDALPPEIRPTEKLQEMALASRPELAAGGALVRAGEAEAALADRDRYPDFMASATYDSMEGPAHRIQIGVGVNIPNQRERRRAQVREAELKVGVERLRLAEVEDVVRLEVETARRELEKARRIHEIYENRLVPAGRDRVAAAEAGFSSGTNDFSSVVAATNDLRELEIERETTLAEVYTHRARLDRALGILPFVEEEVK